MRAFFILVLAFFTLSQEAFSYELLMIQTVSNSRKSFVTRSGKRQGITENFTATFTAENVSLIARARTVTSQFTQWEVVNPQASVPFDPGMLVTYHAAEEYVWALSPEKARIKYIEDLRPTLKRSWLVKSAVTRGLNESVSNVEAQSPNRGGVALDLIYEKQFSAHFAWDVGLRYESELVNLAVGTLNTQRIMLVGDIIYYFDPVQDFYKARVFIGAGMGIGQSSSNVQGIIQSGTATLLPAAKLGMALPFNKDWDFVVESAFETLRTEETLEDRTNQSTTQSNLRIGIGLRKFF